MTQYGGLIIAAGRSQRMGSPKVSLCHPDGTLFLRNMVEMLSHVSCNPLVVCLPTHAQVDAFRQLTDPYDVHFCFNEQPDYHQTGSILSGLKHCDPQIEGVVVWPIDTPFASPTLLEDLIHYGANHKEIGVVAPAFHDKAGHPIVINRSFFQHLLDAATRGGIRELKSLYPNQFIT